MSDGWLYYFVSIVCLAGAVVLFSLDAACSGGSNATTAEKKKLPPLVSLRRWILIFDMVLSVTGLAMFITGISVDKDAELVSRDAYFAIGGITLAVSLCLLITAVSLSMYHQVTVRVSLDEDDTTSPFDRLDVEGQEPKLDPLDPEPKTEPVLDRLDPYTTELDILDPEPGSPKLDKLDSYSPRSNFDLLDQN